MSWRRPSAWLTALAVGAGPAVSWAQASDVSGAYSFDDAPSARTVEHPPWFKRSFLDLREDLREAAENGKAGIVVYFGQAYCAYCRRLIEDGFGRPDIRAYVQERFDVIGLEIFSNEPLVDPAGEALDVQSFALRAGAQFTPTLLFYATDGAEALRLRGYYPPYRLRAALEYVADGHFRELSFRDYVALADPPPVFEPGELIADDLFAEPPYALDRSRMPAQRPLLVIFEQGECHPCEVLHSGPLKDATVRERLAEFEVVQLDMWDDRTPLLTPDGQRTRPKEWGAQLGLHYAPALLFFDENGREVVRLDSVVQFYRMGGVLEYVLGKDYLEEPIFQRWRRSRNLETQEAAADPPA